MLVKTVLTRAVVYLVLIAVFSSVCNECIAQLGWRKITVNRQFHANRVAIERGNRLREGIYDESGQFLGRFELLFDGQLLGVQPKAERPELDDNVVDGMAVRGYVKGTNGIKLTRDMELTFPNDVMVSYLDFVAISANESFDVRPGNGSSRMLGVYHANVGRLDNDGFIGERNNNQAKRHVAIITDELTDSFLFDMTEGRQNRKGGIEGVDTLYYFVPKLNVSHDSGTVTVRESGTSVVVDFSLGANPCMYDEFDKRFNVAEHPKTGNVVLEFSSGDESEFTVQPKTLTFNSSNWNQNQQITIRGVDDRIVDGDITSKLTYKVSESSFHLFRGIRGEIKVKNINDDQHTPPRVTNASVNGGETQRSIVDQLIVDFSMVVNINDQGMGAFAIREVRSGDLVDFETEQDNSTGKTRLTFLFGDSLPDGVYELRINSNRVSSNGVALDGNGNGQAGGDYFFGGNRSTFFRLFADANGDRKVNFHDFVSFRQALNEEKYDFRFDVNFDEKLNWIDFLSVREQFGKTIEEN